MKKNLSALLVDAEGRSEFVIVVVADVRGFSAFSTVNESPNIAMFIKRFYAQMLDKYFKKASFAKTTGDGLLMTFPYSEKTLQEQCSYVLDSIMTCLNEFPDICKGDPMINFEVPKSIGFGVARGTACCLYSGKETIDYSGHLLNLASRLMDLARPAGVVVDGSFLMSLIPEAHRERFAEKNVYLRSIAEEKPIKAIYLKDVVRIPDTNLTRLKGENWKMLRQQFTVGDLKKLAPRYHISLEQHVKSADKIKVALAYPRKDMPTIQWFRDYTTFEYDPDGASPHLILDLAEAQKTILPEKHSPKTAVVFEIQYVPK